MKHTTFIFTAAALLAACAVLSAAAENALQPADITVTPGDSVITGGWADMAGMKYPSVTPVIISDKSYSSAKAKRQAFTNAIASDTPKIIVISGDIDLSDGVISDSDHSYFDQFNADGKRVHDDILFTVGSNTVILGTDSARLMFGGLELKKKNAAGDLIPVENVIIRNVTFYDAHGSTEFDTKIKENSKASIDALSIQNANNIWVDHCTFTDGKCVDLERNYNHDGQFDIKAGKNITVSWCEVNNHDKVMLVGNGDKLVNPEERQITLHHNYFHGTVQRMPRTRGTDMHIYNNFYDNIGTEKNHGAALGPGIGALFIVENNVFARQRSAVLNAGDPTPDASDATLAKIYHAGNIPELNSSNVTFKNSAVKDWTAHESAVKPWNIPYAYSLEPAADLEKTIPVQAGSGKKLTLTGTTL